MREFAVAIGRAGVKETDDITFKLGDDEITAKAPTVGQLALMLAGGQVLGMRSITSLIEFFSDITNDRDWRRIQGHLRDGMDISVLSEIASWLIGEWSGRPTMLSVDSSPTPNGTGEPSTEKPPSTESTTSNSESTVSATSSNGG